MCHKNPHMISIDLIEKNFHVHSVESELHSCLCAKHIWYALMNVFVILSLDFIYTSINVLFWWVSECVDGYRNLGVLQCQKTMAKTSPILPINHEYIDVVMIPHEIKTSLNYRYLLTNIGFFFFLVLHFVSFLTLPP